MNNIFNLQLSRDWNKAVIYMRNLAVKLHPDFEAQLYEDGKLILKKLKEHIENQDLGWAPLSDKTIELKHGNDTIYVETGTLRDGLTVRRIKSSVKGSTIIVGASPWAVHKPSGLKLSQIMVYMEEGTHNQPARPLLEPTYEEVQDILQKHWKDLFKKELKG